jgi:hypothetical protein
MNTDKELFDRITKADHVYDLLDNWLKDKKIVDVLEKYKNSNYYFYSLGDNIESKENIKKITLNVHATIAAYFLFFMITISENYEIQYKNDFILNMELLTTFTSQNSLKDHLNCLTQEDQLKELVESGFNVNVGFIWNY